MKTTKMIRATTEALGQMAYKLACLPDAEAARLKAVVLRLHQCKHAERVLTRREQYEFEAAKLCVARWQELPSSEEENPLDDYERLRQVRIAVFGSAPESPYITH